MEQPSSDDKLMAMLAHILAIPTTWVAPLIIYLLKKDTSKFAAFHALQVLLLQVGMYVVWAVAAITVVGIPVAMIMHVVVVVLMIIAGIKAFNGELYQYPVVGPWARQHVGV